MKLKAKLVDGIRKIGAFFWAIIIIIINGLKNLYDIVIRFIKSVPGWLQEFSNKIVNTAISVWGRVREYVKRTKVRKIIFSSVRGIVFAVGIVAILNAREPSAENVYAFLSWTKGLSLSGLKDLIMAIGITGALFSWLLQIITDKECGVEMSVLYAWKYPCYIFNIIFFAASSGLCIYLCSVDPQNISNIYIFALLLNVISILYAVVYMLLMCKEFLFSSKNRRKNALEYLLEQLEEEWEKVDDIIYSSWCTENVTKIFNDYESSAWIISENPIIRFFKLYYKKRLSLFTEKCLNEGRPYAKKYPTKFPCEVRALYTGLISVHNDEWQTRLLGCTMGAIDTPIKDAASEMQKEETAIRALFFCGWLENYLPDVKTLQSDSEKSVYPDVLLRFRAAYEHLVSITPSVVETKYIDCFAENLLIVIALLMILDENSCAYRILLSDFLDWLVVDSEKLNEAKNLRPIIFSAALKALSILQRKDYEAQNYDIIRNTFESL